MRSKFTRSGLLLGLAAGTALGIANGNPGVWIAVGVALGLVFSQDQGNCATRDKRVPQARK
jgi:nucleoside phosphorylase